MRAVLFVLLVAPAAYADVTSAEYPLVLDGGTISCAPGTYDQGGCLTAGDQYLAGIKRHRDVSTFEGNYPVNPATGLTASLIAYHGFGVGGPMFPVLDGDGFVVQTRRAADNPGTDVMLEPQHYRTTGTRLGISAAPGSNPFFSVLANGDVHFGPAPREDGGSSADQHAGTLVDTSGVSGHVAVRSSNGLYLVVSGDLPSGYDGLHGALTVTNTRGMDAGVLFETVNPENGNITDKRFEVDYRGGIRQLGGYTRAQFHACPPEDGTAGGPGTGAMASTLMYAVDTKHWYVCDGTAWRRLLLEGDAP